MIDRAVGLPAGTRVWKDRTGNGAKFGTVMPHQAKYSHGSFPVRFDDGIWEVLDVSYVTVVSPEGSGTSRLPARTKRRAS